MKLNLSKSIAVLIMAAVPGLLPAVSVTMEAESGSLGGDWAVNNSGSPVFITITGTGAGGNPATAARVASYNVTFPVAGTYNVYARLRVGAGGFNDDSMFYGNGFGAKSPTTDNDWQLVNGLAAGGFTVATDVVAGNGAAGNQVWKWVNLSQFNPSGSATETPITFTVLSGGLSQTIQIGAREDGLELDKFVFGIVSNTFTVTDLDNGTGGTPPPSTGLTNTFDGPDGFAFHRFSPLNNGINADGANPAAGVALVNGVLCGTTLNGGAQGAGTVFYMSANGSNFVTIRAFTNAPDAGNPAGELSVSGNGLFGTTIGGGSGGIGAIFAGQTNGSISVLRNFSAVSADNATNSGGASPTARLALGGGTLYGTTGNGTIFAQTTNGATFTVLRNFSALNSQTGTNTDGAAPWGGLILGGDKLYGTASAGGNGGSGVVFSIGTNGAGFTTLHSFAPLDTLTGTNAGGAIPYGGLVLWNGTLYGTAFAGGNGGRGILFSLQTNGNSFTVLHHFTVVDTVTRTNNDGASPSAGLIVSSNVLYGTASAGGMGAAGTVFSYSLGSALFTTLHSFSALANNGTNTDGAFPVAPVLRIGDSLYGTTFSGGSGAAGTVFNIPLPAPPAIITNIVRNGNGSVTLYFLGGPNSTNVVQATTSLTPPVTWQNVSTNIADVNGVWQFIDANNTSTRYYRSYAN